LGHRFEYLDAVDRLAMVGTKGRGALVFQPETLACQAAGGIELDLLADEARHVVLGEETELDDLLTRLGGGSGGARPKVHVAIGADGSLSAGDELAVTGAGSASEEWIVKFAAANDPADIGPLEEAYARMARDAQIEMAETRLIPSATEPGHFATRRFDRPVPGKRLHMVSLGGALEASPHMPGVDYDGFLKATLAITHSMADVEQAFRRMVFNVLSRNRDDHVRQHAYLMNDRGDWRLAPAFDLTFSNGPGGEHYMAVLGEGRTITRAHVDRLAKNHGISARRVAGVIDDVRAALADWPSHARHVGVGVSLAAVSEGLDSVAREFG
jgi:serine/threonine-protein kinase HipA